MGSIFGGGGPSGPSKEELAEQRRKDRARRNQRGTEVARILSSRTGRNSLKNSNISSPGLFNPNSGAGVAV